MQMSVSCILVLGEKGKGLVDDKTVEHWFSSYIGMLYTILTHGIAIVAHFKLYPRSSESLQAVECDCSRHKFVPTKCHQ